MIHFVLGEMGIPGMSIQMAICRARDWRFDVTTGSTVNVPGYSVASCAATILDGKIMVSIT